MFSQAPRNPIIYPPLPMDERNKERMEALKWAIHQAHGQVVRETRLMGQYREARRVTLHEAQANIVGDLTNKRDLLIEILPEEEEQIVKRELGLIPEEVPTGPQDAQTQDASPATGPSEEDGEETEQMKYIREATEALLEYAKSKETQPHDLDTLFTEKGLVWGSGTFVGDEAPPESTPVEEAWLPATIEGLLAHGTPAEDIKAEIDHQAIQRAETLSASGGEEEAPVSQDYTRWQIIDATTDEVVESGFASEQEANQYLQELLATGGADGEEEDRPTRIESYVDDSLQTSPAADQQYDASRER